MICSTSFVEILHDYVDSVLSDRIRACETVKRAAQRFVDDLERSKRHDPDFPFYFDEEDVEDFCGVYPSLLRHSKGEWAGQPFELSPWQVFLIGNIHGWKRRADHSRRFRKAFCSVARKNGKTSICAGEELIMLALDGEQGAEVYVGATKLDQAKLIHDEAERMLRKSPVMARHADILKNNIAFAATNSFARPLGSDKPFDGLNPSAVFFDEFHAWQERHREFYETMTSGSAARLQPLEMIITTAANEKSQMYHEEANYARGVLEGTIKDEELFALIYELDKDDDPFCDDFELETLIKSNPNYGISVKPDYLLGKLNEAKNKPQTKNRFIRYHGNRCVSSVEDAITAEVWDAIAGELSDWKNSDGIGAGFDLGGRDDLAAFALCAKFQIGEDEDELPVYRYEVRAKSFMAANTKRDLSEQPFATWIETDKLIKCDHPISTLKQYLIEECEALGIEFIAYDPYQAALMAEELEAEGLKPVKMAQNHGQFNETIETYLQEVTENRFKPDVNDEVLRWCALNMALNRNSQDRVMPDKKHSKDKIDAAVAMLMAKRACGLAQPPYRGSLVF